jgi:YtcA family
MGKIQNTESGGSLFGGLPRFGHLNLFRISDFVLRICNPTAILLLFATGCDPVINIGGTFFPGWMVSILIGSALTVVIRYVFVFTRLERHVGPLALIYTSLGLLLSVVSWLILYRS